MSGRRKAATANGASSSACRVVIHLDLDCYYAQVEQHRLNIPADQPVAVQQWGTLLAVNYVARKFGVLRGEHFSEALKKCPTLHLPHVDTLGENRKPNEVFDRKHQKAILRRYRVASREIFAVLRKLAPMCEKAGIDEAFLDVTQQAQERLAKMDTISSDFCNDEANAATKVFGISLMDDIGKDAERDTLSGFPLTKDEQLLAVGATIAHEIRETVREQLQFTCSTGIATNKLLAKLASPLNKPDGQTLIAPRFVSLLMQHFPLRKIRGLGGKLGRQLEDLLQKHAEPPAPPPAVVVIPAIELSTTAAGQPTAQPEAPSDEKPKTTVHEFIEKFRFEELVKRLGYETATFVRQVCSGDDGEDPVNEKKVEVKALSSVKQFDHQSGDMLIRIEQLEYWVRVLCEEIILRCEDERVENKRFPLQLTFHNTRVGEKPKSRKLRIAQSTTVDELYTATMNQLRRDVNSIFPCSHMSMHAKDFISLDSTSISNFFTKQAAQPTVSHDDVEEVGGAEATGTTESHSSDHHQQQQEQERKPFAPAATQSKSVVSTMPPSKRVKISSFFQAPTSSASTAGNAQATIFPSRSSSTNTVNSNTDGDLEGPTTASESAHEKPAVPVITSNANSAPFTEVADAFVQFRGTLQDEQASFYCNHCLRSVTESRAEHDDFHFAMDLSRSENRVQAPPSVAVAQSSTGSMKRKTGPLDAFLKR